ncbi:ArsR/SmtB family transcription factor [Leptospira sarikeiensis]|uniref:ArsR family transcriptional regulator n=1 Tax=Leptospira sarikeiensis TaxID=2484943 RepID=A0A4R9KDV7_9LEPT|nr:helix-turn-helix domain-containing protein [Leptospira sarikeiensis]TGL64311.1 ArsR family transcriptional regulator [Leptospira sarikeiensis]
MSKNPTHPGIEQIELNSIFEAVSDPIRRKILWDLSERGESNCSTFLVYAPKTNLSYHMSKLREAGLIFTRYEGTQRFSILRKEILEKKFPGLLDTILESIRIENKELSVNLV